jgi:Xaa-Pro dipeptidase
MKLDLERFGAREIQSVPHLNDIRPDTPKPAVPFTREEFNERLDRIRRLMDRDKIDLLLISGPDSMYYFHGYNARYYRGHGPTADPPIACTAIHVDHDFLIHFDYPMEEVLLAGTSIADEIRYLPEGEPPEKLTSAMMRELKSEGWLSGIVGMELASHLPNPLVSRAIESAFLANGADEVLDATRLIRSVRRVKSAQEIAYMQEAARICDIGHRAGKELLHPGVTETEVVAEIVREMYRAGGETPGIVNAVVSGPYLHLHGWSTRREIQQGDIVVFDLSGVFNRYHATAVRTYFVGEPRPEMSKLYRIIGRSMDVVSDVAQAGTPTGKVCQALKDYYEQAGVWELYEWAGGFEFGIGFPPDSMGETYWTLDEDVQGVFDENETTTYYAQLNTQIADTYVVGRDGSNRLSRIPDELIVVD